MSSCALSRWIGSLPAGTMQRQSLANTPMTFAYRTGRGTGFIDRFSDAGDTALGSIGLTLTAPLWVVAGLGPPFLVLALVFLLWRRWGRRWWAGLVERSDPSRRSRPSCPSLTSQPSQNRPRCFPPHHDVHGGRLDAKSGHPGDERVSEVGERERVRECPTLGQNGVRKVADGQVVRACVPLVAAHC